MKFPKRDVTIASAAFAVSMVVFLVLRSSLPALSQPTGPHDALGINGNVIIKVNGHQVYSGDTVMLLDYNYVVCKIFNDSGACTNVGATYSGFGGACQYRNSAGALISKFFSQSECSQLGVGLSTDSASTVNTNPVCPSPLAANGFSPVKATTTFTINTNTISLTATWTATASQSSIQKVCLFPWNDQANAIVQPTNNNALAIDTFTAQSLTNGQSLSIQWTFTF